MTDGDRLYPVDYAIWHHAVTPQWAEKTKRQLIDWFSANGKSRTYKNGAINPEHVMPYDTNQINYTNANFIMQRVTAATPDATDTDRRYGWRIFPAMHDPWNNVSWGAGNWAINRRAVNIETCGNYLNDVMDEKGAMCFADYFRGHDISIKGQLKVRGHQQVSQVNTQCPATIMQKLATAVDMLNSPDKWNQKLWPKPVEPKVIKHSTFAPPKKMVITAATKLADMPHGNPTVINGKNVDFTAGTPIDQVGDYHRYDNGLAFFRTQSSVDGKRATGIRAEHITDFVPEPPKPKEPVVIEAYDPAVKMITNKATRLIDYMTGKIAGNFGAAHPLDDVAELLEFNGKRYVRLTSSVVGKRTTGVPADDVDLVIEVPTQPPVEPEPPVVDPPTVPDPVEPTPPTNGQDTELRGWLYNVFTAIGAAISKFLSNFKK